MFGCFRAYHIPPIQWPSWQHMAMMWGLERYVSGNPFTHSDGWLYTNVVPSKAIIMNSHIPLNVMAIFINFLGMPSSFFPNCPFHLTLLTSLSSLHFPHPSYIFFWTLLQCFHNVVSQHYFVVLSLCALFLDHLFILFVFLFFYLYCSFLQLSPQVFIAFAPNVRIESHYVLLIVSHHTKEKFQDLVFCALICCFSCNTCTSSSPFFYLHYIVGFFVVLREFMIFKLWVFFQSFPLYSWFFIAHGYSN